MGNLSRQPGGAWRLMLVGVLALVSPSRAVGQPAVPPSGYDSSWYLSDVWSGEYPPGFSVTRPDTTVCARHAMQTPGISAVGPGQTGYGSARDLTAAEASELEAARNK